MANTMIRIEGLTKAYKRGRGIFDIDLAIQEGECFGYVGTNGSGKTTTIRTIMGFIRPDKGSVTVKGLDAWKVAAEIKHFVSYIPGEIAFPSLATGMDFLKNQAEYLGVRDFTDMNAFLKAFKLDPAADLKRMSKGMKQKTAIATALMSDKEILILDEPTTGLDPLMRDVFIDVISREKKKGKTIFMSGHIFEEIEQLCDRVAFLKEGHIVDIVDLHELRRRHKAVYHVGIRKDGQICEQVFTAEYGKINAIFEKLKLLDVAYIREEAYDLERYFNEVYKGGNLK